MTSVLAGVALGGLVLTLISIRWCLPMRSYALLIGAASFTSIVVLWPSGILIERHPILSAAGAMAAQLMAYLALLAWRFYRDPERQPPQDTCAIVSPADGRVIYIHRIAPGSLLTCNKNGAELQLDELAGTPIVGEELWQIGISMVFTDVHVNRAPVAGTVSFLQRRPGKFLSLRRTDALSLNERQTIVIDNGKYQLALVQIASRLVRQIHPYVAPGQMIDRAQRVGMIRFGSQVDVFLPTRIAPSVSVTVDSQLVAGESELAFSTAES